VIKRSLKILDKVTPGASRSLGWEVLVAAFSFPASILLNRTLGAEDRGLLALTILIPSTIFAIGACQWDRLLKGLITSKKISGKEAWRRTKYYVVLLSFIFIPVAIFLILIFDKVPSNVQVLSILYCVNFPIFFLASSLSAIYVAVGSIDGQYLMRIGLQGSYLILLFGLFLAGILSIKTMVVVYISIHIVSLLCGLFNINKLITGIILQKKPSILPLTKAFLPYLLESFSTKIDIWVLSIFGSLANLGNYTAITSMMIPVGLVSNAMTSGSTSRLDWTQPHLVHKYLSKTLFVLLCLLLLLSIGGLIIGPYLLKIVLGKSFESGAWMIPWIAMIVVSQAAALQFHSALQLTGYLNTYLLIQSIEPFFRLIIVIMLGYFLSELGVMLGIIITSIGKLLACFWAFNRKSLI
jgi:O-antigen/teichoic acid export membrane protein